jgi:hypothetical protein
MLSTHLIRGFREEMEKDAFISEGAKEVLREHALPLGLSAGALLAGGASVYDMYKGRKHKKHFDVLREAMYDEEGHVDSKEYLAQRDPSVKVISTIEDAHAFAQDELMERPEVKPLLEGKSDLELKDVKRQIATEFVKNYIIPGSNAGAVRGLKGDYIVASRKAPPAILEHELGHIHDFRDKDVRMVDEDDAKNPYTGAEIRQFLWKPSYQKRTYKAEVEAWDRAKRDVRDYDKLREAALGTYDTAFHRNRASATGLLALGLAALAKGTAEGSAR